MSGKPPSATAASAPAITLRWLRVGAGAAVIVALLAFAALLAPVYYRDLEFGRALDELARSGSDWPAERLRETVVQRAARLGLPVSAGQVRLERSAQRLRIEVRYLVPVDLSVYSVRLHFHPSADVRYSRGKVRE